MAEGVVTAAFRGIFESFEESQRNKREMYLEVGRAIVSLSIIEEYMAAAFVVLSRPMSEKQAGARFYNSQSINDKLKLLGGAVVKSDWSAGKQKWPPLSAKISSQKWVRNEAAHSSLGFRYEKAARKWHIKLQRQEFDKKKSPGFEISDVRSAAMDLEELSRIMQKFLIQTITFAESRTE
jgi:hypothetical protein